MWHDLASEERDPQMDCCIHHVMSWYDKQVEEMKLSWPGSCPLLAMSVTLWHHPQELVVTRWGGQARCCSAEHRKQEKLCQLAMCTLRHSDDAKGFPMLKDLRLCKASSRCHVVTMMLPCPSTHPWPSKLARNTVRRPS